MNVTPEENVAAWRALHDQNYFETRHQYRDRKLDPGCAEEIAVGLGLKGHERVLEIGCGYGRVMHDMVSRCGDLWGVDIHERPLAAAREILAGRAYVVLYDGITLPFREESFDAVYSVSTFQHMPPKQVRILLAETWHVLVPGGRALIETLAAPYERAATEHRGGEDSMAWTAEEMVKIGGASEAGFDAVTTWLVPRARANSLFALFEKGAE